MEGKMFESEMKAMELVWANEPVSAKQLSLLAAEEIGWNKNTTYTVVKKLEAKGCIIRERCPEDERCVIVSLTAEGEALREKAKNVPRCMAEKSPLTEEEAAALYEKVKDRGAFAFRF